MTKEFQIYQIKSDITRWNRWIDSLPFESEMTDFQKERNTTWKKAIQENIAKLQDTFKPRVNKTYLADFSGFNQNIDGKDGRATIDFLRSMTRGEYVSRWETYHFEGFEDGDRDEMVECFYCNAFYFHIDKQGNTIITGTPWDPDYEVNIVIPTNLFETCMIACVEPLKF